MSPADLVLFEEDFHALQQILRRLRHESGASVVLLVDKNGQRIAFVGEVDALDMTALASLTAGNVAATDGLARILGEREFSVLLHEGEKENIYVSIVSGKVILVVIFGDRASLEELRPRYRRDPIRSAVEQAGPPHRAPDGRAPDAAEHQGEPTLEAAALSGYGVLETLKAAARQVLMDLRMRPVPRFVPPSRAAL